MALISEAVTSSEPSQSTPCSSPRPWSARMIARPTTKVTTPIGRLTKKTQCQLSACGEQPAGEQAERAAGDRDEHVRAHRAGALDGLRELGDDDREDHRRLGGGADALQQAERRSARLASAARPHSSDATVNVTRPARNTRLRPMRSPSRPASSSRLPNVTRNALTTQVRFAWLKWRSLLDRGERDVHDRDVEHDHQLREADDDQRGPPPVIGGQAGGNGGSEVHTRNSSLSGAASGCKVEATSEITGGLLQNYTEGPSVCQRNLP